ncbi:hypothetical protein SUGI_0704300 [Cryptomeria japonica]|nr:hypothetical protein SUGI_0704300 [Cryptomeria japonica]
MGNEMPNRNIQAGPEEDNMQNQTSQQSSSDGVVAPIEKKMPKSTPLGILEDDSGSGSKKEATTNKDAMASKVKTSAVDGDQQVQGKNSEENTQKSAIGHEVDAARVLDDKIIEPQKALVPAEESIKRQEGSSMNEEVLTNDTEYNGNKDENTTPPKLEIAAMQVEGKHFDESIKISLAELKQPFPESESIINDNQTETVVSIANQMTVNERMLPTLMNACESTGEITDMSSSNAKSEVCAKKDPNLEYNEDKQAVDEVALQSGTQEPLVMSLPSEDVQKMSSPQASGAAGAKDIQINPVTALQILSQQHGLEEMSTEDKIFSATELCSSQAESTKMSNGLQPFSEVKQDADLMHVQQKTMSTEENGLKEPVKQPSGASNILNEMKGENISTENAKINSSEVSNGFLHDENIKAKELKIISELGKPEIPTVVLLEKREPEKREVDITDVEVMEKNVKQQSASEILEENNSFQINSSEVSNGLLHNENIKAKEEKITSELGKPEIPTVVPLEKSEPEKREVDITAVELMEKNVKPQSDSEILEENNSFQINSSEGSNGLLHDENIKAKEEKITSELGKPESPTVVPLEKSEPEKQEKDITAVEVMEKNVKPQSASENLEENNSLLLHQGLEYKNNTVSEVENGLLKVPNCLQSKLEPIQGNQGRSETVLAVIDAIQESVTLLSPPEHMDTSDMTLLQELKIEASNEGVSNIVDKLENPAFEQFTDEFLQNDHDKGGEINIANGTMDGPPPLGSIDKMNMVPLVKTKDKPSGTSVTVLANEVSQLAEIVVPESSASMYTIEVEGHDFNNQNKAANIATFSFEKKEQPLQSQNDWHAKEKLNGMTQKDERDIFEPEVNKLNDYKDSLSSSEFTSNQTEEKSDQTLQNSSSSIKDSPQEQEDVSEASDNEMQKQDVNGGDTKNGNAENGMLSILDKEIPTWPATNITSTAGTTDEQHSDMGKEDPIQLGDKSKPTTTSNSELYPKDYVSCPTLESWHEGSEDDPKTPLLATAPGSPEEKKESRLQDNLDMDDTRVSLERTDSEKIRTPLRHLFKDDSTVAVPEQIVVPKEQGIAKEKSVKDIWGSPAKLVSTPPSKEKQKTKSIFTQCICCSAVH